MNIFFWKTYLQNVKIFSRHISKNIRQIPSENVSNIFFDDILSILILGEIFREYFYDTNEYGQDAIAISIRLILGYVLIASVITHAEHGIMQRRPSSSASKNGPRGTSRRTSLNAVSRSEAWTFFTRLVKLGDA